MAGNEPGPVGEPGGPAPLPGRLDLRDSLRKLAASNAAVIVIALWQGWPLALLLWPYWLQSLIIGWYYGHERLMALPEGPDTGVNPAIQRSNANFFMVHYGGVHLVFLFFLLALTGGGASGVPAAKVDWVDLLILTALGVSFVFTHRASYARIIEADVTNRPHFEYVIMLPYLRIIPMYLMIGLGIVATQGAWWAVLLFGVLKTIADLGMHYIEDRITTPKLQPPGG